MLMSLSALPTRVTIALSATSLASFFTSYMYVQRCAGGVRWPLPPPGGADATEYGAFCETLALRFSDPLVASLVVPASAVRALARRVGASRAARESAASGVSDSVSCPRPRPSQSV